MIIMNLFKSWDMNNTTDCVMCISLNTLRNEDKSNLKLIKNTMKHYVKLLGMRKWDAMHYFERSHKVWDDYKKQKGSQISWQVRSIYTDKYEYEWNERKLIKIRIDNWDDIQILSFSYTNLSRWLFNALCSQEKLDNITISLYMNKDWYKSASIFVDWTMIWWKYDWKTQQEMVDEVKNKKWEIIQRDWDEFDKMITEELLKIEIVNPADTEWAEMQDDVWSEIEEDKTIEEKNDEMFGVR